MLVARAPRDRTVRLIELVVEQLAYFKKEEGEGWSAYFGGWWAYLGEWG